MSQMLHEEPTRRVLTEFVAGTERILLDVLRTHDPNSTCFIKTSLDLGFPPYALRIAGGFPTGILVSWNCRIPFIPVDATVNVCTGSVFSLDADLSPAVDVSWFDALKDRVSQSSYILNFDSGNHFASFCTGEKSGQPFLVLHSSASEFKRQFNGLFPTSTNWYADDIQVYSNGERYIRYIVGRNAELFAKTAKMLEPYNCVRHEFMADSLLRGKCRVTSVTHHHHYYMPTSQSVMIGSYLLRDNEVAPIFTYPGDPMFLFAPTPSSPSRIRFEGIEQHLIPHGWGKACKGIPNLSVDWSADKLTFNGKEVSIRDGSQGLYGHMDLELRRFGTSAGIPDYYFDLAKEFIEGSVTEKLLQRISCSRGGVVRW